MNTCRYQTTTIFYLFLGCFLPIELLCAFYRHLYLTHSLIQPLYSFSQASIHPHMRLKSLKPRFCWVGWSYFRSCEFNFKIGNRNSPNLVLPPYPYDALNIIHIWFRRNYQISNGYTFDPQHHLSSEHNSISFFFHPIHFFSVICNQVHTRIVVLN